MREIARGVDKGEKREIGNWKLDVERERYRKGKMYRFTEEDVEMRVDRLR